MKDKQPGTSDSAKGIYSKGQKPHWSQSYRNDMGTSSDGVQSNFHPREQSKPFSSPSAHGSVRLNPFFARRTGLKLFQSDETFDSSMRSSGLAAPDDTSWEKSEETLRMKEESSCSAESSNKRILHPGMFGLPDPIGFLDKRDKGPLEAREDLKEPRKQVRWWQVTLFLLNDVSEGNLILFSATSFATNGWILGALVTAGLWPMNVYLAHLLWRCRNIFPGAISMGDLVHYLSGSKWAMYAAFLFVNMTIAFNMVYEVLLAASGVYWLTGFTSQKCFVVFLAGVCLLLFPVTQLRTLHSLTIINAINLFCVLCFTAMYMYFLARNGPSADAITRVGPNVESWRNLLFIDPNETLREGPLAAISIVITNYHYQILALEIIAEMKDPREFPKANYWCTPVVLFTTLGCGCFRYYYEGEDMALNLIQPISVVERAFAETKSGLAYFAIICFILMSLGSSLIRSVILTRSIQLLVHPKAATKKTWTSRLEWAGISVLVLCFALVVSFGAIVYSAVVGSMTFLLTCIIALLLPMLLYVVCKSHIQQWRLIPWYEWIFMLSITIIVVGVMTLTFTKMGLNAEAFEKQEANFTRSMTNIMTNCHNINM